MSAAERRHQASKRGRKPARKRKSKPIGKSARKSTRVTRGGVKNKRNNVARPGPARPRQAAGAKAGTKVGAKAGAIAGAKKVSGGKVRARSHAAAKPLTRRAGSKSSDVSGTLGDRPKTVAHGSTGKPSEEVPPAATPRADSDAVVVNRLPAPSTVGGGTPAETSVVPGLPVPIASFTI